MPDDMRFSGSPFVGGNWINGFGITFAEQDGVYIAQYTFKSHQQGPPTIAHGGAVAALLDEAMTTTVFMSGYGPAFTVNLNISYRAPIYVGETVTIIGELVRVESLKVYLRAEILLPNGILATEAEGLFIRMVEQE
ncbi:MAG: PaaI family thioesterase [Anaerolineae bacterium]